MLDETATPEVADAEAESNIRIEPSKKGWATSGGRYWIPSKHTTRLPAGVYSVGASQRIGVFLDLVRVVMDELVVLPHMGADTVLNEIKMFMQKKDRYRKYGVVHKRGILMEGPPGTGKTSNAELLIRMFTKEMGGVVMLAQDPASYEAGIKLIRDREPERPIMIVIEDIDDVVRKGGEQAMLNLLDGRHQADGVVIVATTNHLDKLPDRIANRPSRFDLVVKIGEPEYEARIAYVKHKHPEMPEEEVLAIAEMTNKYTIAHLKEFLILTTIYEMSAKQADERIRAIMKRNLLPDQATVSVEKVHTAMSIHGTDDN